MEIAEFIERTAQAIRAKAAEDADPHDPQRALDIAVMAWQLVTAICDEQGLVIATEGGVITGLARPAQEAQEAPAEDADTQTQDAQQGSDE